jgi:hypothetical protein
MITLGGFLPVVTSSLLWRGRFWLKVYRWASA